MRQALRYVPGLVAPCALLVSCTDDASPQQGSPNTEPSSPSAELPRLITYADDTEVVMQAGVGGRLRVNAAGCFSLGEHILVAPPDSDVIDEGQAIEVTGVGRFSVGDLVEGGGGYAAVERVTVPEVRQAATECRAEDSADGVVFLQTPIEG